MLYVTRLHIFDEDWKKIILKDQEKKKLERQNSWQGAKNAKLCILTYSGLYRGNL